MKRTIPLLLALLVLAARIAPPAQGHILRVSDSSYVDLEAVIDDLERVPLIFMGELHDNLGHHIAQLQVIRSLIERGVPVTIGLEMFRKDSQAVLDRWVSGRMTTAEFMPVYQDNWSMWETYRPIFQYAQENRVPMLGLNISREITSKVSRSGFDSLSPREVGEIPGVRCNVDEKYKDYIRRVLGGHAHENSTFLHFCEAQLLWDAVMAKNLLDYLAENPQRVIVVLAGSGHAWKYGIPEQIRRQIPKLPYRVLLPEIEGRVEADDVTIDEADYLMMGLDQAPLH